MSYDDDTESEALVRNIETRGGQVGGEPAYHLPPVVYAVLITKADVTRRNRIPTDVGYAISEGDLRKARRRQAERGPAENFNPGPGTAFIADSPRFSLNEVSSEAPSRGNPEWLNKKTFWDLISQDRSS